MNWPLPPSCAHWAILASFPSPSSASQEATGHRRPMPGFFSSLFICHLFFPCTLQLKHHLLKDPTIPSVSPYGPSPGLFPSAYHNLKTVCLGAHVYPDVPIPGRTGSARTSHLPCPFAAAPRLALTQQLRGCFLTWRACGGKGAIASIWGEILSFWLFHSAF